jgi:hypothetical protein
MHQFQDTQGCLPKPWSDADAELLVRLAQDLNSDQADPVEINAQLLELFSKTCSGDLSPMAAAIGGVAAQVSIL